MLDTGLSAWITSKRARAPIGHVVVTRGAEPSGAVDRIEPMPGETDEEYAERIAACAQQDARAFQDSEPYFAHLFREGQELPEARRPLTIAGAHPSTLAEDEHEILGITMRGLTDSHRTMVMLAKLGLDNQNDEKIRLALRVTQLEDRFYADMDRNRKLLMQEEELAEARENRKERAALFKKALEQFELLLPVGVSYLMHGERKGDPAAAGVLEAQLLQQFVACLTPEQQGAVVAQLDQIQRIALLELQDGMTKGNFAPEMVAPLVQRVMANLTREQVVGIADLLTSDEQRNKFAALYAVRKHTMSEQVHAELAGQRAAAALGEGKP
jgi:hypothetical protein